MTKKYAILLYFVTAACVSALAQPYLSRLGRFNVDQKKGCAPFTVTVTNLLGGTCIPGVSPCAIDYGDGSPLVTNPAPPITHTYTTAKAYTLTLIYQSLAQQQDDITITADPNTQPNFEIYACAGAGASIKVTDNAYDQYVIDYNNDATPEAILPFSNTIIAPPYVYAPPGSYNASVRGRRLSSADNCTPKTQAFATQTVLPIPTINTLTSIDNTSLKLDFTIGVNIQYKLEIAINNSSTFQQFQTLFGVNTVTITNLKLDQNYYCFRLGAYDPCIGSSNYSNLMCSDKFTVAAVSDINQLTWSTGATAFVTSYSIARNKVNYVSTATIGFNDTDIVCKTDYCYQITNNYVGGSKSISLERCVTSFSTKIPTGIGNVSAVVGISGVDLNWVQDIAFTPQNGYAVKRSTGGSGLIPFNSASTTKFSDNIYTTEGKYCYQVNYVDKCGNASTPGVVTCPVRLDGTLDKNNVITLVWSPYKGWKNGVKNYLIEKYNKQGSVIKSVTLSDTTFVDDQPDTNNQLVRYEIKPQSNDPGLLSSSNLKEFIKSANLYFPTAFTPNNDNLNDGFKVSGQYIVKMSLNIFDRWGAILFTSDKNEPWDGHRDGKPLPASTYVWKVEITDLAGRTFSQEGTVALIRN